MRSHFMGDTDHPLPLPPFPPLTAVQKLRCQIGCMSDCLRRCMDQMVGDVLDQPAINYIAVQMLHLGKHMLQGAKILEAHRQGLQLPQPEPEDQPAEDVINIEEEIQRLLDEHGGA